MTGKSSILHKHTESSRGMRGAWKAGYEYISELRTKRTESAQVFPAQQAATDPAHVIVPEYLPAGKRFIYFTACT